MFRTNPPVVYSHTSAGGRRWWRLDGELIYSATLGGCHSWVEVVVPAGFMTDGASVPRFFWRILPPVGDYWRSAILHDYLYCAECDCSRFFADALFRDAMRSDAVPWWRRVAMYYAVRLFGSGSWRTR